MRGSTAARDRKIGLFSFRQMAIPPFLATVRSGGQPAKASFCYGVTPTKAHGWCGIRRTRHCLCRAPGARQAPKYRIRFALRWPKSAYRCCGVSSRGISLSSIMREFHFLDQLFFQGHHLFEVSAQELGSISNPAGPIGPFIVSDSIHVPEDALRQ